MLVASIKVFILFLAMCSCATVYVADHSKLKKECNRNSVIYKSDHIPMMVRWDSNSKELSYLAAMHDISFSSKTFQMIEEEYQKLRPEVVIIENSIERWASFNRRDGCSYWLKQQKFDPGEPYYAACLAYKYNAKVVPAEPSDLELIRELKNQYKREDFTYFFVVRGLRGWAQRSKIINNEKLKDYVDDMIRRNCNSSKLCADSYNYKNFMRWFNEKTGENFSLQKHLNGRITTPIREGTFLQRLSADTGVVRDIKIIDTIAKYLTKYNRVLLIYGAGHLCMQEDVLRDMLDNPSEVKF